MKIKSIFKTIFLGNVGPVGRKCPVGVIVDVPDSAFYDKSFASLVNDGEIEIMSSGQTNTSIVSQYEFNKIANGIYISSGTPDGAGIDLGLTAPYLVSDTESYFDLRKKSLMKFLISDLYNLNIQFEPAMYSYTEMMNAMNNNVNFSKHLVASIEVATEKIRITSKALGTLAKVIMVQIGAVDANDIIKFPLEESVGTGLTEKINMDIKGPIGTGLEKAKVKIGIYTAATDGSLVTGALIQNVSVGTYETMYSNEVILLSDFEGKIKFEVAHLSASTIYVELGKPDGYFLAEVPSARLAVVIS